MIVGELLGFLDKIKDKDKKVQLTASAKRGWLFKINCPITNVLKDEWVFVSNAFSTNKSESEFMTVKSLLFELNKHSSDNELVFEIYGTDGTTNEQIICERIETLQDVHIYEKENCVEIDIKVNRVGNVNNTFK